MMKKLFFVLFLTIGFIKVSACKCVTATLAENYLAADVVGVIKILKIYDDNYDQRTYKADIEFERIYKGEKFKTLTVRGLIGNSYSGACEVNIEVNETYLILLNKYNEQYVISSCSPKYKMDIEEKGELETLEKTFTYIDKNKYKFIGLKFTSCFDELQKGDKSALSSIKNFFPKNPFAIYRVKVNSMSKIEKLTPITTFGDNDKTIETIMMNNMVVDRPGFSNDETNEFLILLLYFKENINKKYGEVINSEW